MDVFDFEVEIGDPAGEGYPVAARAPAGEAAASMRLSLTREELDYQIGVIKDAVQASSAIVRSRPSTDEQPVRQFGRQLFDALIADDIRTLYVASAQRARDHGARLRLVLRIRAPELARLPWEFLYDPGRQDYVGLSLPLVRYPQVLAPRQPIEAAAPLRILGMVARPGDQDALAAEDEKRRLHAALDGLVRDGQVELAWVPGQAYGDLEDAMDRGPWHVFHFVGHGGYDPASDEGTIALAGEHGRTDAVGADDLSRLLSEHYTLRLVVLNACETGRGSALDMFSSTAGALTHRGIPAVVAMQFPITDEAAIRFAQTFYQNIAKRLPVDTSVMRARRELRRAKKDTLEWGTPVLYLRAPDGRVFAAGPAPADPAAAVSPPQETTAERPPGSTPPQDENAPDVEALYDKALAAYWTEKWDLAVSLLREVLARGRDQADIGAKLEYARRQLRLATSYAEACAAADAGQWDRAIAAYEAVVSADAGYRDVSARLETARRQRELAGLHAEARRLHKARQWAALLRVGERIQALDPASGDPEGMLSEARAELDRARAAEELAADYRRGLRLIEAGEWQQAVQVLELVSQRDPGYQETAALIARVRRELAPAAPPAPEAMPPAPVPAVRAPARPGPDGQPVVAFTVLSDNPVAAVEFSPDSQWLAVSDEKIIRILNVADGSELAQIKPRAMTSIYGLAFSPDGRWLAYCGSDSTARITVAGSWAEAHIVGFLWADVYGVAFSQNGDLLAAASSSKNARIWLAATGWHSKRTYRHPAKVYAVAFSPADPWLATGSADGAARIWDIADERVRHKLNHDGAVRAVTFSSDGRWLATVSGDSTPRIWNAEDGVLQRSLPHGGIVSAVAFSPDDRWLATGCADKTTSVWDPADGRVVHRLAHEESVRAVAFSPDGRWLATGDDQTVRLWGLTDMGGSDG
jgi:WD40 repeat protein